MDEKIIRALKDIVGADYVMDALEDRICYAYDASFKSSLPDIVVRAANTEQIVKILVLARQNNLAVTPRGSATSLTGGAVPLKGGISLDLDRMDKIISIDKVNRVVTVEPGKNSKEMADAIDAAGMYYPPDPASAKTSTIGGNIAECAGGPHGVKYGITRNYVLGLEVVLPTGEVVQVGNMVDSEMSGPDWTMLFVGSEGTLGIVTKIFLKIVDKPKIKQAVLANFDNIDNAAKTVSQMIAGGTIPTTLEIMDNLTINAVENYLHLGLPVEAEAVLLIEVDGTKQSIEDEVNKVVKVCKDGGADKIKIARTASEIDELWIARRSISPACGQLNPTKISEDATVPRSKIPDMVRAVKTISGKYNLKMVIFGHAGDGNLHPNILANKDDEDEMQRVDKAVKDLFHIALGLGGTLSGEHGIGYMKAPYLKWELGETGFAAGRNIKDAFDKDDYINPGKMFKYEA